MERKRVLFVCEHNSARSQMAEALLNTMAGDRFEGVSAGFQAGKLNPQAVKVMAEVSIDISSNQTKTVFSLYRAGTLFDYVITVCDEASRDRCPVYPGYTKRLHWRFEDPSGLQGSDSDKLEGTRRIRDQIKAAIEQWLKDA